MPWKRPASVPVGQVWSRFQGREVDGQPAKMFQIRDLDEEHKAQCLELLLETFLNDEPLSVTVNIRNDPESIASVKAYWETMLEQQVSLMCLTKEAGPSQLVAFNIMEVKTDQDEENKEQVNGEPWKKIFGTLSAAEELVDPFAYFKTNAYLTSSGLTVSRGYRGQNIGARMLQAREPLCKALGIKATSTVFTAITSQVLAKKSGYEVLAELPYEEMKKRGVDLTACTTTSAKVMGRRFD